MIIKSIQINDNNISIAYQKPSATGLTDIFTLKSKDDPRPELLRAFSNLQNIVKRNFEFFDEFKFKTGWLNVEYADSTFAISVQDLIDECVRFIMGRRAQDSLFNDSEE